MTPAELKQNLLKQYEDTLTTLRKIEGAIYACEQLTEEPTEEEPTTDD